MKKILVVLSLICFVAVNVSNAQTQASATKEVKKEAVESKSSEGTMTGCNHSMSKACCKKGSSMKACTPAERAKCAGEKAKAEATSETKGSK